MELIRKIEYPPLGERPAEILESRLYRNRDTQQILLELKLRNISGKALVSAAVDICCFDEEVNLLSAKGGVELKDLQASAGEAFGQGKFIPLPSLRTASVTVTLSRTEFADGSVWSRDEGEKPAPGSEALEKTAEIPLPAMEALLFSRRKSGKGAQRQAERELWQDKSPAAQAERDKKRKKTLRRRIFAGTAVLTAAVLCTVGGGQYLRLRKDAFNRAVSAFEEGRYMEAAQAFDGLSGYRFSAEQQREIQRYQALSAMQTGNWSRAGYLLSNLKGWEDIDLYWRRLAAALAGTAGAGEKHSVGLRTDGRVLAAGDNSFGQCGVENWENMIAVACGLNHTLGLRTDGRVEAVGADTFSQCALGQWENVVGIAAGEGHSVGVLNNGRVLAAGDNSFGQCDTEKWSGVVAVAAGRMHTVGLRQDGTVVAAGDNQMGACDVGGWQDIVAIAAGNGFTVGVRQDGTLVATGDDTYGECRVSGLDQTMQVCAGDFHVLALSDGGRLRPAGDNDWRQGQVALWKNLISAAGGVHHSIGISRDGTAYSTGDNKSGQCEVREWTELGLPVHALKMQAER